MVPSTSAPKPAKRRLQVAFACLCLLQFQSDFRLADGVTISGAPGGLQLAGSTATLGLSSPTRSNFIMNHRSLDMRSPGKSWQRGANTVKLSSAGSMGDMGALQVDAGNSFGDLQGYKFELDEQIELEQLAGLNEIAPPECYNNLFKRFKRWNMKFKKIQEQSKGSMKETATALIDKAFNEVSQRLLQEECEPGTEGWLDEGAVDNAGDSFGQSTKQMSDFIYKILNNVVNQLDDILDIISDIKPFAEELINFDDKSDDTTEEKIKSLLLRIKDRAIDYAKKQIEIKFNGVYQKKALEMGSKFLVNQIGYPGDPMTYLSSMRSAYLSNSLGMIQDLMSNMQFRGAIAFINNQNPMPFMRCKPKKKEQEPYC